MGKPTHMPIRATHRLTGDTRMRAGELYMHERWGLALLTSVEFHSSAYWGDKLYTVRVYLLNDDRFTEGLFSRGDWLKQFKPHKK